MPYTEAKTRSYFNEHPHEAKDPGDCTYVVYRPMYKMWKDEPRFKTFFAITKGQRNPRLIPKPIQDVMIGLNKQGAPFEDVFAAYDCAVLELWTRHVSVYEAEKMQTNGDVDLSDMESVKAEVVSEQPRTE